MRTKSDVVDQACVKCIEAHDDLLSIMFVCGSDSDEASKVKDAYHLAFAEYGAALRQAQKGLKPLTLKEAEAAYRDAPPELLTGDRIREIVEFATNKKNQIGMYKCAFCGMESHYPLSGHKC